MLNGTAPTTHVPPITSALSPSKAELVQEVLDAIELKAQEKAKDAPASAEKAPTLLDLIPKPWRPFVAILLLLLGSTGAGALVNLRAIWGLPETVAAIQKEQERQGDILEQLLHPPERQASATPKP